jgi:hypothetical protein
MGDYLSRFLHRHPLLGFDEVFPYFFKKNYYLKKKKKSSQLFLFFKMNFLNKKFKIIILY